MSIRADVDRGLEICGELEKLEAELKLIEERLKKHGLENPGLHVELQDADREGKQFLAAGTERVVPVVFTADLIVGSFGANTPAAQTIRVAACGNLTEFFKPVNKYENRFESGKKFRARAAEVLGSAAPNFVTSCLARDKDGIAKSAIRVEWKAARVGS